MNISFSVVFGSGWKVTYLVGGRERGVPLMLKKLSSDPEDTSNLGKSSQSIDEKIQTMKKAQVIEADCEVVSGKNNTSNRS